MVAEAEAAAAQAAAAAAAEEEKAALEVCLIPVLLATCSWH